MKAQAIYKEMAQNGKLEPINNWAFDYSTFDSIVGYDLEAITDFELDDNTIWDSCVTEVAKAQYLLNLYRVAFGLKSNKELFEHIKAGNPQSEFIDYEALQRYLVETYLIIREGLELWHKRPTRQYMRDRAFFVLSVLIQNYINRKYIPEIDIRCLEGLGAVLECQSKKKADYARRNNRVLREGLMAEMATLEFFDGCHNKAAKIRRIIHASKKYPRKGGANSEISPQTARRYLCAYEKNKKDDQS